MSANKPDYSFMKSGFNTLIEPEKPDPNLLLNVTSIVATFAENATKDAAVYVKHSNRRVVTETDIRLCLMTETFNFLNRDNDENISKWREIILNDDIDEDYSTSEDEDYEEQFSKSECKCELCMNINKIEDIWKVWVPTTDLEKILKNVIDNQL